MARLGIELGHVGVKLWFAHLAIPEGHFGLQVVRLVRNSNGTCRNSSDAPNQEVLQSVHLGTKMVRLCSNSSGAFRNSSGVSLQDSHGAFMNSGGACRNSSGALI